MKKLVLVGGPTYERSCKVLDKLGFLGIRDGLNLELNIESIDGNPAKYSIRAWTKEHDNWTTGATFKEDELKGLHKVLLAKFGVKGEIPDAKDYEGSNAYEKAPIEVVKHVGILFIDGAGWQRELNVEINNGVSNYCIRTWGPDHSRMSQGFEISKEELTELRNILVNKYGNKPRPMDCEFDLFNNDHEKKYCVHIGVRLTKDIQVEACSEEDAKAKAKKLMEDLPYNSYDFAEDDIDVWEVR